MNNIINEEIPLQFRGTPTIKPLNKSHISPLENNSDDVYSQSKSQIHTEQNQKQVSNLFIVLILLVFMDLL